MENKHPYCFSWKQYDKAKKAEKSLDKERVEKRVYYYTTVDTFKKIIDNGCLFASHIRYMNDWQEFNSGYKYISSRIVKQLKDLQISRPESDENIKDYIKFFEQEEITGYRCKVWNSDCVSTYEFGRNSKFFDYCFPQVYNISFTKERDLLSQWKMYAKESGIAIEFDFSKSNKFGQRKKTKKGEYEYIFQENKFPRKVIYDSQLELSKNKIGEVILNDDVEPINMINVLMEVPYIKNQYYKAEEEARLIFRPFWEENTEGEVIHESEINYRESNHVLIPYLTIVCLDDTGKQVSWPIVSLTIGPGNNQEIVFSSVIYYVENIDKNICDFTVEEYLNKFEKYYTDYVENMGELVEVDDIEPREATEIVERTNDRKMKLVNKIKQVVDGIRKELKETQSEKISQVYDKGKFQSYLNKSKNEIHKLLIGEDQEKKEPQRYKLEQYEKDNYLASNGISIHKSQVPYMFN